jgi:hypothetical protein
MTDITYIQLADKTWVYIAGAYDSENRKALSYQIADAMAAKLATSAIVKAPQKRGNPCMCIVIWKTNTPENCLKIHWRSWALGALTLIPTSKVSTRYSSGN